MLGHRDPLLNPEEGRPWNHTDLTVALIDLMVVQIQHAIADNDTAMLALTTAHHAIGQRLQAIANALTSITPPDDEEERQTNITEKLSQMIMAFQGHDALNQRLEHVCFTLNYLKAQLADDDGYHNKDSWRLMLGKVTANYTIEDERKVHKQVMDKHPELAQASPAQLTQSQDDDTIELF